MVKITPEEVLRRRRLEQTSVDELTPLDRAIVGEVARLDIPLTSIVSLRRVADHLRGLADMLDHASRQTDMHPRALLFQARMEVRAINGKLRSMRSPGRPLKNYAR